MLSSACDIGIGADSGWWGRKYQFMEMNLQKRMGGLKEKIPDIQKTLDSVKFLKLRKVSTCSAFLDKAGLMLGVG
jgi:hypothetical protein